MGDWSIKEYIKALDVVCKRQKFNNIFIDADLNMTMSGLAADFIARHVMINELRRNQDDNSIPK